MSKRNLIIGVMVVCLCCGAIPQALANDGDSLDYFCRQLQLEVQAAVGDEDPAVYKNHGAYVSAVAHLVDPYVESGEISEECASCIISQFARRIPIAEQEPCGPEGPSPECEGAECGSFQPCNEPTPCPSPVCVTTYEGGGWCVEGSTPCAPLIPCPNGTGDCPEGSICAVRTCCEINVCVPPEAFCEQEEGATKGELPDVQGPTIGDVAE